MWCFHCQRVCKAAFEARLKNILPGDSKENCCIFCEIVYLLFAVA
jgi:hypothetical protein